MKKTTSIALAGYSFVIEEHAYIKLSDYLDALRKSLTDDVADEVMKDIDIRMAEIFKELLGKREVINDDDVEKVINQIGQPEVIEQQEGKYYSEHDGSSKTASRKEQKNQEKVKKVIYRDPIHKVLGGVCAGLANYFGIDITIMRVIWMVLFFAMYNITDAPFLNIFIYLILWVIIPKATSKSDLLKMQGLPVNFDTLKESSQTLIKGTSDADKSLFTNEKISLITNDSSKLNPTLRRILGIIFVILAILSLMSMFAGMISGMLISKYALVFFDPSDTFLEDNIKILNYVVPIVCLLFAILFGGIANKLFYPNTKLKGLWWVIGILFLTIGALSVYLKINENIFKPRYTGITETKEETSINTHSDTIYVDLKKVTIPKNFKSTQYGYTDKKTIYKPQSIDIQVTREKNTSIPYLVLKKQAIGASLTLPITASFEINGNTILIPETYQYPYKDRLRSMSVDYKLVIPEKMVIINKNEDKISLEMEPTINANAKEEEDDYDEHHSENSSKEEDKDNSAQNEGTKKNKKTFNINFE